MSEALKTKKTARHFAPSGYGAKNVSEQALPTGILPKYKKD
ncbi:hypothetical protein [Neobacillus sp. SAB-20_R2A]